MQSSSSGAEFRSILLFIELIWPDLDPYVGVMSGVSFVGSRGTKRCRQQEEDGPSHTRCGFFGCQPQWLQPLANKFAYLLVYCACGLIQGMWYTYFVSILSTVEKTFKFPSSVTGIILAGNDLAQIFFSVCISYYGNKGSRPRWVGAGMLMNALGCLLSALPHFVWGPDQQDIADAVTASLLASSNSSAADLSSVGATLCQAATSNESLTTSGSDSIDCNRADVSLVPVILLFLSQFVSGIGATSYYTLGMTYMDDSVDKENSPLMFALSAGLRVMGPMLGFVLGSFALGRFVVPGLDIELSRKDPRWIGAWWLGFFVLAALLVIVAVLMCFFPKVLPERHRKHQENARKHRLPLDTSMGSKEDLHGSVQPIPQPRTGLISTLRRLLRNTLLVTMLVNVIFAVLGFIGYFTFLPKYQQAAFNQSAATASLFTGLSGVLVTLLGYLISGVVMKIFRPRSLYVTGYGAVISGIQTLCMVALMSIKCEQHQIYGSNDDEGRFMWSDTCNSDCNCGIFRSLSPVCATDGSTNFVSPCYAGCREFSQTNGTTVFGDCACMAGLTSNVSADGSLAPLGASNSATSGFCPLPCSGFTTYIIILALMKFLGSTNRTGGMLVFFRSVADEDKSVAMGMSTALLSIFCFIPAPIIFGAIVDSTCQIWEEKPCGGRGSCLLYDIDRLRINLHSATIVAFGISFVLELFITYLARNIDLYGEKEKQKRHQDAINEEESQQLKSRSSQEEEQ